MQDRSLRYRNKKKGTDIWMQSVAMGLKLYRNIYVYASSHCSRVHIIAARISPIWANVHYRQCWSSYYSTGEWLTTINGMFRALIPGINIFPLPCASSMSFMHRKLAHVGILKRYVCVRHQFYEITKYYFSITKLTSRQ